RSPTRTGSESTCRGFTTPMVGPGSAAPRGSGAPGNRVGPAMSVPTWLHPLYEAERMRATDRWAIEDQMVPSLDLMERAGAGATRVVAAHVPAGRVAVVC